LQDVARTPRAGHPEGVAPFRLLALRVLLSIRW
jgi:hypothetical protein